MFPGGGPPLPIETPTVDIQDLISSAGRRGADQSNFFEIYDWSAVVDESQWITALGTPNRTDRPDFYPGTHGRVEFALFEDRWITMWSGWCTATASNLDYPPGTSSVALLWPDDYRELLIRRQAGAELEGDRVGVDLRSGANDEALVSRPAGRLASRSDR